MVFPSFQAPYWLLSLEECFFLALFFWLSLQVWLFHPFRSATCRLLALWVLLSVIGGCKCWSTIREGTVDMNKTFKLCMRPCFYFRNFLFCWSPAKILQIMNVHKMACTLFLVMFVKLYVSILAVISRYPSICTYKSSFQSFSQTVSWLYLQRSSCGSIYFPLTKAHVIICRTKAARTQEREFYLPKEENGLLLVLAKGWEASSSALYN